MAIFTNKVKTEKIRNSIFLMLALTIFLFNFSFKTNLKAVDSAISINAQNLLVKHNQIRQASGLPQLTMSKVLNTSAINKAQAMLASNCWSHYCPEGQSPWEFFDNANYKYKYAGENLAEGFYNVQVLMDTWMNSPTHKENILNPNFNEIGFGIVSGKFQGNNNNLIVVAHFGKRDLIENEPYIKITNPINNQKLNENSVNVNGTLMDVNNIIVKTDTDIQAVGTINNGSFTARIENVPNGNHSITASGVDEFNNVVKSNEVNFEVNIPNVNTTDETNGEVNLVTSSISPDLKNNVNIAFILIIGLLFLIDLLILSRTSVLKSNRSFSHYHFILVIITGIAITIGSFGGNILSGVGI